MKEIFLGMKIESKLTLKNADILISINGEKEQVEEVVEILKLIDLNYLSEFLTFLWTTQTNLSKSPTILGDIKKVMRLSNEEFSDYLNDLAKNIFEFEYTDYSQIEFLSKNLVYLSFSRRIVGDIENSIMLEEYLAFMLNVVAPTLEEDSVDSYSGFIKL